MCRRAGFRWGGAARRELTRSSGARSSGSSGERLSGLCSLFCVFPFSASLLFLFPLFAVLLKCPYPNPPVSACFFPFSSAPRQGEGRPRGAFVADHSQTITSTQNFPLSGSLCAFSILQLFIRGMNYCVKGHVMMSGLYSSFTKPASPNGCPNQILHVYRCFPVPERFLRRVL